MPSNLMNGVTPPEDHLQPEDVIQLFKYLTRIDSTNHSFYLSPSSHIHTQIQESSDLSDRLMKKNLRKLSRKKSDEYSISQFDARQLGRKTSSINQQRIFIFEGGFKSTEDYTYVRGRGRGKYVCAECGIRCKKPSMLRKHIRTHTDLRPYSCSYCVFAFKTKGNLTKHMVWLLS